MPIFPLVTHSSDSSRWFPCYLKAVLLSQVKLGAAWSLRSRKSFAPYPLHVVWNVWSFAALNASLPSESSRILQRNIERKRKRSRRAREPVSVFYGLNRWAKFVVGIIWGPLCATEFAALVRNIGVLKVAHILWTYISEWMHLISHPTLAFDSIWTNFLHELSFVELLVRYY